MKDKQVKQRTKGRSKRTVGRPITQYIERIPDTPENVARALFGIKRKPTKEETQKPE